MNFFWGEGDELFRGGGGGAGGLIPKPFFSFLVNLWHFPIHSLYNILACGIFLTGLYVHFFLQFFIPAPCPLHRNQD